jgi:hypothetical protein
VPGWFRRPKIRKRLRRDAQLTLELTLCHDWGIPHSQFLDWDPSDRAKATAFFLEKSARCSSCGTAQWEWDDDPNAFQPVTEFCQGCYRRESALEDREASLAGMTVVLVPTASQQWKDALAEQEEAHRRGHEHD